MCTDDDLGQVVEWVVADNGFPGPQGVIDGGDGEIRSEAISGRSSTSDAGAAGDVITRRPRNPLWASKDVVA